MAKELFYFKFTPSEWLTGDIFFEDLETQGLFINVCALYWHREGKLTIDEVVKRYPKTDRLTKLTDRFISVIENDISIKFLDEQIAEFKAKSLINSVNGKCGGRPKTLKKKPNAKRTESEPKAKKSHIELEIELDNNIIYLSKEATNFFNIFNQKYAGLPSELIVSDEYRNSLEQQAYGKGLEISEIQKEMDNLYRGKDFCNSGHVQNSIGFAIKSLVQQKGNHHKRPIPDQKSKSGELLAQAERIMNYGK